MTFRPERQGECEAAKIAPIAARYLQGRALDIGAGLGKVWPSVLGIDTATHNGRPASDILMDGTGLSAFSDASFDAVFSSFLLQMFEPSQVPKIVAEWARLVKVGGYLTLYLPDPDAMPKDADPSMKWRPDADAVEAVLRDAGCWTIMERETRHGGDEYGLFLVYRRDTDREDRALVDQRWVRNPDGKKRALVIRLGAYGDAIVAASIFPHLQAEGYHVSMSCNPNTYDVLKHDPHVDDWLLQDKDFVPNEALGPFWHILGTRYDRVINLSESVEGLLLALPGRLNHSYSDEARRAICGHVNYLEHTHNIAAVPYGFANARFHATETELKWARAVRKSMAGPVVVWVVNGSSMHKVYPWVQVVAKWLLERTPVHLVLYADPGVGKQLQQGILDCLKEDGVDMSRVTGIAGKWTIRQSLTFAQIVDCVVGPETGPMNAVGMETVPKVCYLSHSSADNLTKYWRNTTTLIPTVGCYPCHRLHMDWQFCKRDEQTQAAACASSISPETIFKAIAHIIVHKAAA